MKTLKMLSKQLTLQSELRFSKGIDKGKLIIAINGFQKKTKKLPKSEIEKAQRIKKQYLDEKQ